MGSVENDFLKVFRGDDAETVPFFEVWFQKTDLVNRTLGKEPNGFEDSLPFINRMGWQYITEYVSAVDIPSGSAESSAGEVRYVPGGLKELDQIQPKSTVELVNCGNRLRALGEKAHAEGLVLVVYVEWAFHAINTALGFEEFAFRAYDDPAFLHRAIDKVEAGNRLLVEDVIIPAGVDAVLFDGDCAYKNGLMVKPELLRELTFERTADENYLAMVDTILDYTKKPDG